ncbi:recombinase family protein [Hansschlegelia sp. KR7-227]|uniref:recombinase family protein n=1 Tax=Hansschlegelia sp. KR7-227 TaxID=3400914 RepID=UPI003BFA8342
MRAAIYARFSTDLQNDRSVEDQLDLCRAYARKQGHTVVATFHDRAQSGASVFGRPGLANLMELAARGGIDVLVSEAADRISRSMADLPTIHRQLEFQGISIDCVNGGQLDTLQVGLHGMIGQYQREEGARKVRRGMTGVIKSGRHAGGRAYGYLPMAGRPGELEIVLEQAAVVQRIFETYAGGVSPRTIAAALNKEGVPPPRGKSWNASTINGSRTRGHGILRNPVYAGQLVWNRVRMVKDPATGRRVSRTNDAAQYHRADAEHLRIVDQELFEAVQRRKEATSGEAGRRQAKARRVLSGRLKCGCCGGGMGLVGHDKSGPRIACSTYRESRSCANSSRYYVERIERMVVDAVRIHLSDPDLINEYVATYCSERRDREAEARRGRATTERSLAEVMTKIRRIGDLLVDGTLEKADGAARLAPLHAERDRFAAEIIAADQPESLVNFIPVAAARCLEDLDQLSRTLIHNPVADASLTGPFHRLVAGVIVQPRQAREEYTVEIQGKLSGLLGADSSANEVVAEEGLEPPTRGL